MIFSCKDKTSNWQVLQALNLQELILTWPQTDISTYRAASSQLKNNYNLLFTCIEGGIQIIWVMVNMFSHLKSTIKPTHSSQNITDYGSHHLECLGDDDGEHPDPEKDEQRRGEADRGRDPLRDPALAPGALTATQNLRTRQH